MNSQSEPSTALVATMALVPAVVFAEGGVEALLSKLKAEVLSIPVDISTPQGRAACASLAYKVARSKTALDAMGKSLGEDSYKAWKRITAERSKIETELDALRDQVRKPLTEWENTDKTRIAAHEAAIEAMQESPAFYTAESPSEDFATRLRYLEALPARDWQEFTKRAEDTLSSEIAKTKVSLQEAISRETAKAEAARLAAEKAEQERRAYDALVAENARREAEEKARVAAEAEARRVEKERQAAAKKAEEERQRVIAEAAAKAAEAERAAKAEQDRIEAAAKAAAEKARRERDAVEAEKVAAEVRARQADQDRITAIAKAKAEAEEAAAQAEAARKAAAERAEHDQQAALEAERRRVASEKAAEKAAGAAREADKKHRAKVNGEALAALVAFAGLTDEQAKAVVTAIVRHEIPRVSIAY